MTQDEIIEMARQLKMPYYYQDNTIKDLEKLVAFAKLVAQHEREACAKFIEHDYVRQFEKPWRDDLSAAIRARGSDAA
jgi:hypothetical protein